MRLFADDTSLYIEFDNASSSSEAPNDNFINIQQSVDQWLVKFSPSKTKLMTCIYKKMDFPPINFNGIQLKSVKNDKHMGLTLSYRGLSAQLY